MYPLLLYLSSSQNVPVMGAEFPYGGSTPATAPPSARSVGATLLEEIRGSLDSLDYDNTYFLECVHVQFLTSPTGQESGHLAYTHGMINVPEIQTPPNSVNIRGKGRVSLRCF